MGGSLADQIQTIMGLNEKATKGNWFWSARTLRCELLDEEGEPDDTIDVLHVDSDRCIYAGESDGELIVLVPQMVDIIAELLVRLAIAHKFIHLGTYSGIPRSDALSMCDVTYEEEPECNFPS